MNDGKHMTKEETKEWMGYETISAMDDHHDPLHQILCDTAGVTSFSLLEARGETLSQREQELAWAEENAVLHLQRWLRMHGVLNG